MACGGGMHGRGNAWQGEHAWQGGMHGRGSCMAGGHAWQGGMCSRGACMVGACETGGACIPQQILWDTVNERAVRILLECILVKI